MSEMKILEFRKLTTEDVCYKQFGNWSRCYEYAYALNAIKQTIDKKPNPSVHNTCSGSGDIHLDFARALQELSSNTVHSDFRDYKSELEGAHCKFMQYNILEKMNQSFDFVLCISSLEDLYVDWAQEDVSKAFNNLLDQVNDAGRLIITCDYPTVPTSFLENFLNQKILDSNDNLLNGLTSVYRHDGFPDYNIILIDIEIRK